MKAIIERILRLKVGIIDNVKVNSNKNRVSTE